MLAKQLAQLTLMVTAATSNSGFPIMYEQATALVKAYSKFLALLKECKQQNKSIFALIP